MAAWWQGVRTVVGVDFSGAAQAGDFIFLATLDVTRRPPVVQALINLGLCVGSPARAVVLSELVRQIAASEHTLWGIDFPFALPLELYDKPVTLDDQLRWVGQAPDDAAAFGRHCVGISESRTGRKHVRRTTDVESRTPFDCYHYRIIHQTFHGMRSVLAPLRTRGVDGRGPPPVAIPPFDRADAPGIKAWVAESCPSSTLKRWGLPHHNYKQTTAGPLSLRCRRTRHQIYEFLRGRVVARESVWRTIGRNRGGDALDSLIAALGVWEAAQRYDPSAVAAHPRYPREGLVFF